MGWFGAPALCCHYVIPEVVTQRAKQVRRVLEPSMNESEEIRGWFDKHMRITHVSSRLSRGNATSCIWLQPACSPKFVASPPTLRRRDHDHTTHNTRNSIILTA